MVKIGRLKLTKEFIVKRNRYYYTGHFEGYTRRLYFRLDSAQYGNVSNPDKRDEYGFICDEPITDKHIYNVWKNMERRCYVLLTVLMELRG